MKIDDIIMARNKMKGIVHMTPLDYSKTFSGLSHNEVYLKLENLQKTGSFKVRGSYNKLSSLSQEQLQKGVIAASAGNHAQGVAYSSQILDVPCTIVMPKGAPLSKILATKKYGAEIVLEGDVFNDALFHAEIYTVDEMEMARTMLMLLERNKLLVEGSGASSLAALLYEKVPLKEKKVVAILSGGNVDVSFISRIIEYGMVESGRYVHFSMILKDKPGELEKVLNAITTLDANVQSIHLNRIGQNIYPGYVQLDISIETKNHDHIARLYKALHEKGYQIEMSHFE